MGFFHQRSGWCTRPIKLFCSESWSHWFEQSFGFGRSQEQHQGECHRPWRRSDVADHPTGRLFEGGAGFFAEIQWRRAPGVFLDIKNGYGVAEIEKNWPKITDMTNCVYPDPTTQFSQLNAGSKL